MINLLNKTNDFIFFAIALLPYPHENSTHSTYVETLTTSHATTYIEFPMRVSASYPLPVRTLLKGVRPSRQAHLQCPIKVHGVRGYLGGVQHPVEWQATHSTGACPRP